MSASPSIMLPSSTSVSSPSAQRVRSSVTKPVLIASLVSVTAFGLVALGRYASAALRRRKLRKKHGSPKDTIVTPRALASPQTSVRDLSQEGLKDASSSPTKERTDDEVEPVVPPKPTRKLSQEKLLLCSPSPVKTRTDAVVEPAVPSATALQPSQERIIVSSSTPSKVCQKHQVEPAVPPTTARELLQTGTIASSSSPVNVCTDHEVEAPASLTPARQLSQEGSTISSSSPAKLSTDVEVEAPTPPTPAPHLSQNDEVEVPAPLTPARHLSQIDEVEATAPLTPARQLSPIVSSSSPIKAITDDEFEHAAPAESNTMQFSETPMSGTPFATPTSLKSGITQQNTVLTSAANISRKRSRCGTNVTVVKSKASKKQTVTHLNDATQDLIVATSVPEKGIKARGLVAKLTNTRAEIESLFPPGTFVPNKKRWRSKRRGFKG